MARLRRCFPLGTIYWPGDPRVVLQIENDLGIRSRAKPIAGALQFFTQSTEVVNLALGAIAV